MSITDRHSWTMRSCFGVHPTLCAYSTSGFHYTASSRISAAAASPPRRRAGVKRGSVARDGQARWSSRIPLRVCVEMHAGGQSVRGRALCLRCGVVLDVEEGRVRSHPVFAMAAHPRTPTASARARTLVNVGLAGQLPLGGSHASESWCPSEELSDLHGMVEYMVT